MYMQTYLASTKRRSDLTDDILVQQAHIGDPGAFEILFERYSALLFLLISRTFASLSGVCFFSQASLPSLGGKNN
jgi:hypothetical protein